MNLTRTAPRPELEFPVPHPPALGEPTCGQTYKRQGKNHMCSCALPRGHAGGHQCGTCGGS